MKLIVGLGIAVLLCVLAYGWLHSEPRSSIEAPPSPPVRSEADNVVRGADASAHIPEPRTLSETVKGASAFGNSRGQSAYQKGLAAKANQNLDVAVAAFEDAVAADKEFAAAWSELSSACCRRRAGADLKRACEAAQHCIDLDSNNCSGWYNLASAHALVGKREAALTALDRASHLNPTLVATYLRADHDFDSLTTDPRFTAIRAAH
jgi:tetratricopeptide (TPR) repeat protein